MAAGRPGGGGRLVNSVLMLVPWRRWLPSRRGLVLLDLWSGGVIGFVAVLVLTGGASFTLLAFLAIPFVAVVQSGRRRIFWLAVAAGTCVLVAALAQLPAGVTAIRLALLAAVVAAALVLAGAITRETARVELEHALTKEASHRIKNNLQTVADILLLGRPENGDGSAFDVTAARIRSIATVHRLLAEADDRVDGNALLAAIAEAAPQPVAVEADAVALDAATAQRLGIVANELITNASRHGASPIVVRLDGGPKTRLRVDDGGNDGERAGGLGLQLVRRMVEQGLCGRFELAALPGGGTRAEVVFPVVPR